MKLGVMPGDQLPADELRDHGFEAVQLFFAGDDDGNDPSPSDVDEKLAGGDLALAAMTLHVDLVGPSGLVEAQVARAVRCVRKTAALEGRYGDNPKPVLVWHPSQYPSGAEDGAVFGGLTSALSTVCAAAEDAGVAIAVEITRGGSVDSAERWLRLQDHVGSPALKVCLDAANFCPDRTPLERAVRVLGPDVVIAHGKDSSFHDNGEVAEYGPTGSGRLDYETYIRAVCDYCESPYFVMEYYRTRAQLLRARDIVLVAMDGKG